MVKVLYTTPILRHPPTGGPQLSVETCIKALSRTSELHIISRVPVNSIGGIEAQEFYEKHCVSFLYSPSAGRSPSSPPNKFLRKLHNFRRRQKDWVLNQDVDFILEYYKGNSIDVIWCDRTEFSFDLIRRIKRKRPDIKVVADTCAVYSRFILRELPYEESPARKREIYMAGTRKEEEEQILVNLADVTTAVSEVDADYYRSLAKYPQQVYLFSNVIDIETYKQTPPPADNFKKPCIYLAGTFYAPQCPMVDATRWVVAEVLPLVRRQIPDIHFYVVGRGSEQNLSDIDDPGITITGELPSVLPYLCHADVALVPLKWESGTRFKILEAGACGIPVVSTTLGAEGIPVTHEKDILIADEPEKFADCIIRLIRNHDLALEMAENLRTLVHENYTISSLAEEGRRILEYLIPGR